MAHPITNEDNFQISVLIGEEFYWTFVEDNVGRGDGLTAQQTKLAYLLSGPTQPVTPQCTTTSFHVAVMKLSVDSDPIQFWSLEETGTVPHTAQETDGDFLWRYQRSSISQAKDGMYTARFSWKSQTIPISHPISLYVEIVHAT